MSDYHRFVFDLENRRVIGDFEAMYQAESREHFDSWNQDDLDSRFEVNHIEKLLQNHRYQKIIDVGCGKGSLTHLMSQYSLSTVGVDVSEIAIAEALRRYPSLQFSVVDVRDRKVFSEFIAREIQPEVQPTLVVLSQVLSYVENWSFLLETVLSVGASALVALYLPVDPIGFVKSKLELFDSLERRGRIVFQIENGATRQHVVLAAPKINVLDT